MRIKSPLIFAGIGVAVFTTPAFAQGGTPEPFTGPKIEVLTGYDNLSGGNANGHGENDGLSYGGAIGYDKQIGRAVFGIEGEVTGSTTGYHGTNLAATGDNLYADADRDLYVGGRLGVAVTPSTLLYAKAGYTNARIHASYDTGGAVSVSESRDLDGYRVGAGVEHKMNLLGPGTYAKLEYRYSNYGGFDVGPVGLNAQLDRHQVLAGVGVRF